MITNLSLDIENKGDCNVFHIVDTSFYNSNLPVNTGILEIKSPGLCNSVFFEPLNGFHLIVNSSLLRLQLATNYESLYPLPDGIYYIKYSINPNDQLFVEYNYLHNCNQYQKYIHAACSLYHAKKDYTKKEYAEKVRDLAKVKDMIDSSKYLAEYCEDSEGAKELYEEVNDQLEKLGYNDCKNCG